MAEAPSIPTTPLGEAATSPYVPEWTTNPPSAEDAPFERYAAYEYHDLIDINSIASQFSRLIFYP